jgi:sugar lactone lactonase YvrE
VPTGVAVDSSGNVFVTDRMIKVIKKIAPAGMVTTVSTNYALPNGLFVDNAGWIFISDSRHLDKVFQSGNSTTFAGPANDGNPMAVECVDGVGAGVRFGQVIGITRDGSGNFFVADAWCHKIRKITSAGVVSTFAGSGSPGAANGSSGSASFNKPQGIAIDSQGNLFVADTDNHLIRKITSAGVVTTLAGSGMGFADGPGASAKFNRPTGLAVDAQGNVFVADSLNHKIRKITSGGVVSTYAGSSSMGASVDGPSSTAQFHTPAGIAIDGAGNLFVVDYGSGKVRKVTKQTRTISIGTSTANTGTFTAALACPCGGWLSRTISANGATQNFECGRSIVIGQGTTSFNLSYRCSGTCSTKYEAVITQPNGTTQTVAITNNANWSYNFNMSGNYSISFKTYCDDSICSDSCIYTVTVK